MIVAVPARIGGQGRAVREGCGDPAQADSNKAEAARAASVDLGYSKLIPGFFLQGASNRTQAWRVCVTLPS